MFTTARNIAREITTRGLDWTELPIIPAQALPAEYSLSQLHENLTSNDKSLNRESDMESIIVLSNCLQNPARLSRELRDEVCIIGILLWLGKAILPGSSLVSNDMSTDNQDLKTEKALQVARQKGAFGLNTLQILLSFRAPPSAPIPQETLLTLIAYTSSQDSWTTLLSLSITSSVLSKQTFQSHSSSFIIDYVLQSIIRPLFSKASRPGVITATGRKAMPSSAPTRKLEATDLDEKSKPWIYEAPYTITVFDWAIQNSSAKIVQASWNMFIPPLLILLDDPTTLVRSRTLSMLTSFIPKMGQKLLAQTGLGDVFTDAIFPTLMFLPNLTPVEESLQLLRPAYEALVVLGDTRYEGDAKTDERMKFYDRVMRKGVLMGYVHSSDHPEIVELLVRQVGILVEKMGIHGVKHLKDIIPIVSTVLVDPFAFSRLPLLLEAIQTLQMTILNCWPRVIDPTHRMDIIKALTFCWNNVTENSVGQIKGELKAAGAALVHAVDGQSGVEFSKDLEPLFAVDPGLKDLFGLGMHAK